VRVEQCLDESGVFDLSAEVSQADEIAANRRPVAGAAGNPGSSGLNVRYLSATPAKGAMRFTRAFVITR